MTIMTLRPHNALSSLGSEIVRLFDDPGRGIGEERPQAVTPPVDILETEDGVELVADLPGIDRESLDVSVDGRVLTIAAGRAMRADGDAITLARRERRQGRFERAFTLPVTIDTARITADYVDGVLTVTLPKSEAARPRRVDVRAG